MAAALVDRVDALEGVADHVDGDEPGAGLDDGVDEVLGQLRAQPDAGGSALRTGQQGGDDPRRRRAAHEVDGHGGEPGAVDEVEVDLLGGHGRGRRADRRFDG